MNAAKWKDVWLLIPLRRILLSPDKLVRHLHLTRTSRVLEVGPGPGFFSIDVAQAIPQGRLELVDIQLEMLQKAREMKLLLLLSVFSILVLAACSSSRAGQTCEWQPSDYPSRLDLQDRAQRLHLMDEALLVEDLAVRYADSHRGHRSGHFGGNDAYQQTREQCMAMLFEAVANHHGVSTGQVRNALVYRRASVDLFVLAMFVAFYIAVVNALVLWMFHSVPSDGPLLRFLVTTVTACGAGAGGLVLFGLYSATFEMIRIGNTHMSYRSGRGPWNQHQSEVLAGGIILFALVAAYRHARDRVASRESQAIEHAV